MEIEIHSKIWFGLYSVLTMKRPNFAKFGFNYMHQSATVWSRVTESVHSDSYFIMGEWPNLSLNQLTNNVSSTSNLPW